ncbi:FixH family protein [Roseimaritima ulvae]|uniref:FixH n=1 Tax=Roseimaritima ulvae TaxID=980254 RepID=A0A5B9QKD9_9BACT|nr:FixH family protein [Roseimaritima ulvae]QEG39567.1 FixH [Roseimaritima ulvae]
MNLNASPNAYEAVAERKAKRFWVSLVVGLLSLQLVIGYVAVRLALGDPTVAIVPDYHQAALNWDKQQAALTAADRLGLVTDLEVSKVADSQGVRAILFSIKDDDGHSVSDLQVTATVYRHARAGQPQTVPLTDVGDGKFMATTSMAEAGLWQVDLEVQGAAEPIRVSREFSL